MPPATPVAATTPRRARACWSIPARAGEKPQSGPPSSRRVWRRLDRHVEIARQHHDVVRLAPPRRRTTPRAAAPHRGAAGRASSCSACSRRETSGSPSGNAHVPARCGAPSPRRAAGAAPSPSVRDWASRKRRVFSVNVSVRAARAARRDGDRVSLSRERRSQQAVVQRGQPAPGLARDRQRAGHRSRGDVPGREPAQGPCRDLLHAEDSGLVGEDKLQHLVEKRMTLWRLRISVEEVPASDQHASTLLRVRVLLADPPAFTPWYDHELAAALAREGADVELATSRFRFGRDPGSGRVPAAPSATTPSRPGSSSAHGCDCR